MVKLRNLVIPTLVLAILITVLGVIASIAESWQFVVSLLFIGLLINIFSALLVARYLAWNARTGEKYTKVAVQKLAASLKAFMVGNDESLSELQQLARSAGKSIQEAGAITQSGLTGLTDRIVALEESVERIIKTTNHHTSLNVHEGVRQVESLVQLHQRYPEVQMPMPNTGRWAIDAQALAHLLAVVEERKPKRVLELGSGTSTIWLGYSCQSFGGELVTLDHLEEFFQQTRTAVRRHELHQVVDVRLAPLEPTRCNGQIFKWYSTDAITGLAEIDMVVIDGPPGSTGPQARYPALPKVIQLLSQHATIILDDAQRSDERGIVDSWLAAFPEFKHIEQGTSRLAVLERQVAETGQP